MSTVSSCRWSESGRSRWRGPNARRRRGCCSRPRACRSPRSRSPPAFAACASSTPPSRRSSPGHRATCDAGLAAGAPKTGPSRYGCRSGRRLTPRGWSRTSPAASCPASRRSSTAPTAAVCDCRARPERWSCVRRTSMSRPGSGSRTRVTWRRPCSALARSWTWTPIRRRLTRRWPATRCWGHWSQRSPAGGCPDTSTATSSPPEPCWGSRCHWPARRRSRPAWSSPMASH